MASNIPSYKPPTALSPRSHRAVIPEAGIDVDLKNPWLAAFLAWLIPGLGHLYQGRTAKGILFLVCILGTFLFGLYIGNGHVVFASLPGQQPYRWEYWCQAGVGLPAMPALVQRKRVTEGKEALWNDFMAPPRSENIVTDKNGNRFVKPFETKDASGNTVYMPSEISLWNHDMPQGFPMGTTYTMIAGLLNIVVIFDAAAGPLVILHVPKKKKKKPKAEKSNEEPVKEEKQGDKQ